MKDVKIWKKFVKIWKKLKNVEKLEKKQTWKNGTYTVTANNLSDCVLRI